MSYLALYREFRPTGFDSLIGQEHVVKTLINQIKTGRIGHAYLFCGARGTGKTTAAKIFARAINCLSPINGSPCGECEVCKKLANPANLDIVEMDAASNNKVENVRDLRDKIQYPPVAGKYKVYIVDEVHMLTAEAFNALLKTLEEPPEHAVFILATTEVQKLPATILSRCLRFDFKLIPTEKIAEHIAEIYDKIGKKYQKEAIDLIARAGEGSMRDALSVADVCVSYSDGVLTYDDVLEVLGASDRGEIEKLVESILGGDAGGVLSRLETLCKRGKSIGVLNRDVCGVLRDLLIVKTCSGAKELLGLPQDKFEEFKKIAINGDAHGILRAIEIFSATEADLKYSTHPRIVFETAALKASMPESDYNIDALISKINSLETQIRKLSAMPKTAVADNNSNFEILSQKEEVSKPREEINNSVASVDNTNFSAGRGERAEKIEKTQPKSQPKTQAIYDEDLPLPPPEDFEFGDDFTVSPLEGPIDPMFGYPPKNAAQNERQKIEKPAYKPVIATFEEKSEVKISEKTNKSANEKSVENLVAETNASASVLISDDVKNDPRKIWGAILKKLREDKEIMLWVACQDVGVKISKSKFYVIASGQSEYNLLTKPQNSQKLGEYVKAACGLPIVVIDDEGKIEASVEDFAQNNAAQAATDKAAAETENFEKSNAVGESDYFENSKIEEKEVKQVKEFFGEENVKIIE